VVFFHGLEDLAVPPAQTRRLHEALAARGLASEYHAYAGEQHGFRKAETMVDVYTRELAFYQRLLG
jgi:dipeptidyl aminopeptidase/acylaminoacyl peptidase